MEKPLRFTSEILRYRHPVMLLILFGFQKSVANTYYINDASTKGDLYTTAIGNDANDGTSPANPGLTVKLIYEKARDGDTIIVDTGNYKELSSNGEPLFVSTKKIKVVVAGISDIVFSKTPLPSNQKVNPAEFYIYRDEPIDREAYLQKLQNGELKKPE